MYSAWLKYNLCLNCPTNILLSEIKGNPEIPKNSYITTSLNKKITPITTESEKKNDEQNIDKKKTDIKNNDQSQQTQSNITEDKKLQ